MGQAAPVTIHVDARDGPVTINLRSGKIEVHRGEHRKRFVFVCDRCSKQFSTVRRLNDHRANEYH
jgi:predicted SprT family Zn-dependent metalloprotease